jgi:hypothetical protein
MEAMTRLRTIAGTFLVTSLLWGGGLVWWQSKLLPPAPPQDPADVQSAAKVNQTTVAYRPQAVTRPVPVDIPALMIPVQGVRRGQLFDTCT